MASNRNYVITLMIINEAKQAFIFISGYSVPLTLPFPDFFKNPENSSKFFDSISRGYPPSEIKAMVVGAQTSSILTISEQQSFKEKCKEFCEKNGILAYFPTFECLFPFSAISKVKPKVAQAENVAVILCDPNGNTRHILTRIGPKFNVMAITRFDYSENPSILREKILEENYKFNQIILIAVSPPMKPFSHIREIANALTGHNVTIMNKTIFDLLPEISVDYVRHLNQEKATEFFVVPYCKEKFVVKVGGSPIIEWDGIYQNPFEESVIVKVTPKKIVTVSFKFFTKC